MVRGNNKGLNSESAENQQSSAPRPPTSADVARLANVSQSTVSLVLNNVGDNRFTEETRQRVLAAAEQLGYVPHAMARSLRAGHSNLVLLPFFDLTASSRATEFQQAIAVRLDELGYTVLLQVNRARSVLAAAQVWASLRPIGVLVQQEAVTPEVVEVLRRAGIQAILALGSVPSSFVPTAVGTFISVGRLAGEHLVSKGHRHIAVLVPRDPWLLPLGLQRLQGIERIGRLHSDLQIERIDLSYDFAEAQRLVEQWRQGPRPTAVFTYNDDYGTLLMRALQDAGFRIPDQIALVGCDDLPICDLLRPRLTSIRTGPARYSGQVLADFLDGLIRWHRS